MKSIVIAMTKGALRHTAHVGEFTFCSRVDLNSEGILPTFKLIAVLTVTTLMRAKRAKADNEIEQRIVISHSIYPRVNPSIGRRKGAEIRCWNSVTILHVMSTAK